jgi:uncharacterized OB-fold protein
MSEKMSPVATPETKFFWDKARERELWLPVCVDTGRHFFPPRLFSPFTGGAVDWRPASGRAKLASYVIVHRAAPGFEPDAPYVVALAELEEGPRMVTNLPGAPCDPTKLKIGAPLSVTFEQRGEMTLPQFCLVGGS